MRPKIVLIHEKPCPKLCNLHCGCAADAHALEPHVTWRHSSALGCSKIECLSILLIFLLSSSFALWIPNQ